MNQYVTAEVDPGILIGVLIFRHKTGHGVLLAKVFVATALTRWNLLLATIIHRTLNSSDAPF
jgi:hypothetical protein